MSDAAGDGRSGRRPASLRPTALDGWMLVVAFVWGGNFSVIKLALREIPTHGFNALRLAVAAAVLLVPLARHPRPSLSPADWRRLALLGLVGHFLFQVSFVAGLERTSVANSAVIFGCAPIAVALLSAAAHHDERVTPLHWLGAALSAFGIYVAVGRDTALSSASRVGELITIGAVWCWAMYTVAARPLLARHPPVVVTAYSLAIGAALYAPLGARDLIALGWAQVRVGTWLAVLYASALSLSFCYMVWYVAVQRLGSARTAIYQNLVPVSGMMFGALWLGESIGGAKIAGVVTILAGVALTRMGPARPVRGPAQ